MPNKTGFPQRIIVAFQSITVNAYKGFVIDYYQGGVYWTITLSSNSAVLRKQTQKQQQKQQQQPQRRETQ